MKSKRFYVYELRIKKKKNTLKKRNLVLDARAEARVGN